MAGYYLALRHAHIGFLVTVARAHHPLGLFLGLAA